MVLRRRGRSRRRSRRQPPLFSYSRWDGTQTGADLDADRVFDELADDLLYHGDIDSALRRLMHEGLGDRFGRPLTGIREMLEKLRERRRELLDRHDLGGVYDDIAESLRDIVHTERQALEELAEKARSAPDSRRAEPTTGEPAAAANDAEAATEKAAVKNAELDMLPPDLAGQVKALSGYEFESDEARQRFTELIDRLREQAMQQFVDRMASDVSGMDPAESQRMKDMLAELNQMLEQRDRGQEPDFAGFMDRYGDFFPENPRTLDELLEVMARRMAGAQAMLNSMTPEQRAQLQALSDQLLEDMDLRWQFDRLARNLQDRFPKLGWDQRWDFTGADPLDFAGALDLMDELGDIDGLENLLRTTASPGALAEVDVDAARDLLGDDAAESLERMAALARMLEEAGLIENREGRFELTPRAIRKIGQGALRDLFAKLSADRIGGHALHEAGAGHERAFETKPYEYGDPFNLHIGRTVANAVARSGAGVPVRLRPDDFEVERTEHQVRSATVLMLDLSLSMPMRDNFLPAKKVAMALHALISGQYPRDYLGLVSFSEVARELRPEKLPEVSWDYVYGTNMQHGFMLARRLLARQTGTRQIIMITDGEPTAHLTGSGRPFFSYPPAPETVDLTLAEVVRCTRAGIRINTFMLDATSYLTDFVEQITRLNGGRAFFTTNQNLGDYVLVDFVEHKRSLVRARR